MKRLPYYAVRIAIAAAVGCTAVSMATAQVYDVIELPTPQRGNSTAKGLNGNGTAVGRTGTTFSTQTQAFVSRNGKDFQLLGTLPGGDYSSAFGVNDAEEVIGASNTRNSIEAFRWDFRNGLQRLGTLPGHNASQAFDINITGDAAGYSSGASGVRAVLWPRQGGIEDLGVLPGGNASTALALSDNGHVAGKSESSSGTQGFVWLNKEMTGIGMLPGDTESQALAVNRNGTAVGFSATNQRSRAIVWDKQSGIAALLTLPGGDVARALGVNAKGEIVGFSTGTDHSYRAVLWRRSDGSIVDLNTLVSAAAGVLLVEAQTINQKGQILVYGFRLPIDLDLHEKPGRMFLLTPR